MDGDTDSWCAQPRPVPVLAVISGFVANASADDA